jgi:anoctamin-10/anoctamin-7
LTEIRDYYGEKIAYYFLWLGFYCHWLIIPSLVGLALFIAQVSVGRVDLDVLPAYGIFVALWATLFLEFWKRKEARHRVEWGMAHYSEREQPRPEFVGESVPNPVDGRMTKVFPWVSRLYRALVSQVVIWTVIGCVIAGVFGVFVFRKALIAIGGSTKDAALPLSSALNAIEIQVFNVFYGWCAVKLNDFENHRTQSEYENALIGKSFIFKFVNSYNSLFYIAFFKQWDETVNYCAPRGDREHDCLSELQFQLGVIFGLMIFVNNCIEIAAPIYAQYAASKQNRAVDAQGKEIIKTAPEVEYELAPYESTFDDFDEMAIQYGYVCLFVVAFPLAPLLALLNNYIEIRLDASKISKFCRRPFPGGSSNIGTWFDILQVISFMSVITNTLICVFSTEVVDKATNSEVYVKVWAFLIAEHIIIGLKLFLAYAIDDEPASMKEHLARQDYLVDVLVNGKEEEPEEEAELAKLGGHDANLGFNFAEIPKKQEGVALAYAISGPPKNG